MITNVPLPSRVELLEHFSHDPETGVFSRIKRTGSRRDIGPLNPRNPQVGFKGRQYYKARIIWKMWHDEEPDEVDHQDMDLTNTRLNNLRAATSNQNKMNRNAHSNSKTGIRGVGYVDGRRGRSYWFVLKAGIVFVKKGGFRTIEDAISARKQAEQQYHGEFAR